MKLRWNVAHRDVDSRRERGNRYLLGLAHVEQRKVITRIETSLEVGGGNLFDFRQALIALRLRRGGATVDSTRPRYFRWTSYLGRLKVDRLVVRKQR